MRIGITGTGKMGAAIAQRLMSLGHHVTVWNRTAGKTRELVAGGARVAETPAALAAGTDAIITILTDAAAIDAVYFGAQGLLSGDCTATLFIEMSTVRPETQAALAPKVKQKGAAIVECPVSGTVGPAREGQLVGFAGGEAADVARARPLLDQICRRVEHVGPIGAGARMKLAINLPLMVYWQAFGEALALCAPLGLDLERVVDMFADSPGGPNFLRRRGPDVAKRLERGGTGSTTFNIDSMRKDLRAMIDEAKALGSGAPVTEQVLDCFDQAAKDGLGTADCTAVPARWMRRAGRK